MKMNFMRITLLFGLMFTGGMLHAEDKELEHECTSWMIFSDLTKNNTNILHKNRDAKYRTVVAMQNYPNASRKWIGLGNDGSLCMGINVSGLAAIVNSGEKCVDPSKDDITKKSTPGILFHVLGKCDTASQAVKALQELLRQGDYRHGTVSGSTFLFMDANEGYVCEMTAKYCSVQRYDRGYTYRANIWRNPGMAQLTQSTLKAFMNSCGREYSVRTVLNKALHKNNILTLGDVLEVSRTCNVPEGTPQDRSVCFTKTNSASSLVIHREFPGVLSTAYCLIGHPRHTIYIPIPVCAEKIHPLLTGTACSAASWKRFDKLGLKADIPSEWLAFEKNMIVRYEKATAEALVLLRKNKKKEAIALMNRTASGIWTEAVALMGLK